MEYGKKNYSSKCSGELCPEKNSKSPLRYLIKKKILEKTKQYKDITTVFFCEKLDNHILFNN